jgi:nuclear cap-binding protein subunit 2
MAELYHTEVRKERIPWDRNVITGYRTIEENLNALKNSCTIYVGNLAFSTKETQIRETFSMAGPVKNVIMGINRTTRKPCGFCFVEYHNQEHAKAALLYLSDTACDDRIIRCGWDSGFKEGRQYGRGKSGGQIRDENLNGQDPGRPVSVRGYNNHRQPYVGQGKGARFNNNHNNGYHHNSSNHRQHQGEGDYHRSGGRGRDYGDRRERRDGDDYRGGGYHYKRHRDDDAEGGGNNYERGSRGGYEKRSRGDDREPSTRQQQ